MRKYVSIVGLTEARHISDRPCQFGHAAIRYTSNGQCVDCSRLRVQKWQAKYKKPIRINKTWAEILPLRVAYNKEWRRRNPEKAAAHAERWRKANPEIAVERNRRRQAAKLGSSPAWANKFFMQEIYHLAKLRTKYLGIPHHVDHIVPLQGKNVCGLHVEHNLQVIPAVDNLRKANHFEDQPSAA
jgi:hypothetical protein